MNKRRKLKSQLGKKYRYKKFMTAFEVKKLLESQMDKNQERLSAATFLSKTNLTAKNGYAMTRFPSRSDTVP